jgi:hypothetical protein
MDITGDGIPDVLVLQNSGGSHCCATWLLFSVGPSLRLLSKVQNESSYSFPLKNIKGDGVYQLIVADWTFASWNASFAESPIMEFLYAVENGTYKFAPQLMRGSSKSEEDLVRLAAKVPWEEGAREDVIPPEFWKGALTLILTGNADQVRRYAVLAWRAPRANLDDFLASFYERLKSSPHYSEIKILNPDSI